jgi:hypothetical protein
MIAKNLGLGFRRPPKIFIEKSRFLYYTLVHNTLSLFAVPLRRKGDWRRGPPMNQTKIDARKSEFSDLALSRFCDRPANEQRRPKTWNFSLRAPKPIYRAISQSCNRIDAPSRQRGHKTPRGKNSAQITSKSPQKP